MKNPVLSLVTIFIGAAVSVTSAHAFTIKSDKGNKLSAKKIATFNAPWAMTFINGTEMLVTTRPGKLWLVSTVGKKSQVKGIPKPAVGGQGGLGDVIVHPNFAQNGSIYISMVEPSNNGKTRGAIVLRGKLDHSGAPKLTNIQKIWTQTPKLRGKGHFSHRLAFGPKGSDHEGKLFITSGDRQAMAPAQKFDNALGKIIRLNEDGSVPADNPYQSQGQLAKTFWSMGHRNLLGIAFDSKDHLWSHEMGPADGDELNRIIEGKNYGWPVVSEGNHYSGKKIPSHKTRPEFAAPKTYWVPTIAPSGLVIYSGEMFKNWQGDAFVGGLRSRALIRVDLNGDTVTEAERFRFKKRIREVEQGPKGALWVLEDKNGGRLLRLVP